MASAEYWYEPIPGATTHVYLGEAHRRRGALAAAEEHLRIAVGAKPGRAGAWINLALVHLAQGRREEADAIFERLERTWPRLLWDARRAMGESPTWPVPRVPEVLEQVLSMMRGNRSSHTITYFDDEGRMRIAQRADVWQRSLNGHASYLKLDLQRRLALGIEDC